jgi:hypothetical protein
VQRRWDSTATRLIGATGSGLFCRQDAEPAIPASGRPRFLIVLIPF